ncbi:hypothetical protein NP493_56g09005 [Ridgeia piscesae]|uniref:Uncharacterized protein n=1 Tax=Ridgeia piscesae TaxID=27915 RepID=A0AAD9PB58_RIDPI|nr:hypothetical protein NP493_56g09005 [Ridgeia piscesae]
MPSTSTAEPSYVTTPQKMRAAPDSSPCLSPSVNANWSAEFAVPWNKVSHTMTGSEKEEEMHYCTSTSIDAQEEKRQRLVKLSEEGFSYDGRVDIVSGISTSDLVKSWPCMVHINPETRSKVQRNKRKKAAKMSRKVLGMINELAQYEWTDH